MKKGDKILFVETNSIHKFTVGKEYTIIDFNPLSPSVSVIDDKKCKQGFLLYSILGQQFLYDHTDKLKYLRKMKLMKLNTNPINPD